MHSLTKIVLKIVSLLFLLVLCFVQILVFMYLLRSEGPHKIFLSWFFLTICMTFAFYAIPKKHRLSRIIVGVCCALIVGSGIFTVVVQVQVSRRSLAEAWLERARGGEAFGFFSFFASEVYALFIFLQIIFFSKRKYVSFFFSFFATISLCYGLVFNNILLLLLSFLGSVLLYASATDHFSWKEMKSRLSRFLFPLAITVFVSFLISLFVYSTPDKSMPSFPVNFSSFVQRIAPQFPLLSNIPGYGYSTEAHKMPRSTYLTTRSLFEVNATPLTVQYLITNRFVHWNGSSWNLDNNDLDSLIPVSFVDDEQRLTEQPISDIVQITLVEDFYTSFPIKSDTVEIQISKNTQESYTATEAYGLFFNESVTRGTQIVLLQSAKKFDQSEKAIQEREFDAQRQYTSLYSGSSMWQNLVANLKKASGLPLVSDPNVSEKEKQDSYRDYVKTLLSYFSKDFTYSLSTDASLRETNPIEHFLFDSKKGFCIYYATAFVLLAREAGIPARMVEGFRISIDEMGRGSVTGSTAHAWPELWIDGQWRTFEPTPAFMSDDPFSYVRENDYATRTQLEQVFSVKDERANSNTSFSLRIKQFFLKYYKYIFSVFICVGFFLFFLLVIVLLCRSEAFKIKKRARMLVKRYKKKGIASPKEIGWLSWYQKVASLDAADASIAHIMISLIYREN